jgi:hypothetical protein
MLPKKYHDLRRHYYLEHRPRTQDEQVLLDHIALCHWRLNELDARELALLVTRPDECPALWDMQGRLLRHILKSMREFERLQSGAQSATAPRSPGSATDPDPAC